MSDPRQDVLRWLDEYRLRAPPAVRESSYGIDVLETARSPLFLALLDEARGGRATRLSTSRWVRWRSHASQLRGMFAAQRLASAKPSDCDYVFWPRHRTHLDGQIPVARELARRDLRVRFVVDGPALVPRLTSAGFSPIVSFKAFRVASGQGWDAGRKAAHKLRRATSLDPKEHVVFEELARQLPTIYSAAARAERILDALKPRGLIVGNDITIEGRAATQLAQARCLTTACMMHGIGSGNPLLAHHIVDRMLLYGSSDERALVALGADPRRLVTVGAPYLDDRPEQTGLVPAQLKVFAGDRPPVVLALSGPGDRISKAHHERIIAAVDAAAGELEGTRVLAKLHPKDRLEFYERASHIVAFAAKDPRVPHSIFDWLQGAAALITAGSAVGMEAMLFDVPTVTVDFEGALVQLDYVSSNATTYATDAEEVSRGLTAHITGGPDAAAKKAVTEYLLAKFGPLDGKSAARAADAIVNPKSSGPLV